MSRQKLPGHIKKRGRCRIPGHGRCYVSREIQNTVRSRAADRREGKKLCDERLTHVKL